MKDEEEISRMLASLKTVDAPEDFEGGVRSRIAKRRDEPALSRPSLLLVAKFAFPMLLLLAVGGFLIVSDSGTLKADMVPPVGNQTHEVAVFDETRSGPSVPDMPITNRNSATAQAINRSGPNSNAVKQNNSQDQGLSQDNTTVFPDGLDPRNAKRTGTQPPPRRPISPISLLSMMGILSACTPQSCQVREVSESSLAGKAGVHVGDIITKIGDRPIDSFHSTSFEVRSIEVVRDGKSINISIGRP
jgi:hypothetical protein